MVFVLSVVAVLCGLFACTANAASREAIGKRDAISLACMAVALVAAYVVGRLT